MMPGDNRLGCTARAGKDDEKTAAISGDYSFDCGSENHRVLPRSRADYLNKPVGRDGAAQFAGAGDAGETPVTRFWLSKANPN